MPNVLVLCSGSVAAIKVPELLESLRAVEGLAVRLVVTEHARCFYSNSATFPITYLRHFLPDLSTLGSLGEQVLTDSDEWDKWWGTNETNGVNWPWQDEPWRPCAPHRAEEVG